MKKFLALLLALVMLAGMIAGCGAKPEAAPEATPETGKAPVAAEKVEENEEPIVIKWIPHTLDFVAEQDTYVEKLIEERFNVELEVAEVNTWQADTLNVYLASSPEFDFMIPNIGVGDYYNLYDQGLLRTIDPADLEAYMPNWMAACRAGFTEEELVMEEEIANILINQFGGLVTVPTYSDSSNSYMVMAMRSDWLESLGLEAPTTFEEFVDTLIAFAEDDPDGNGIDDTYGIDAHPTYKLNYMHLADGVIHDAFVRGDDGQISFIPASENWKNNLKKCAELYAAGAIDPEWVTDSRAIVREKFAAGKFGCMVDNIAWFDPNAAGNMTELLKTSNPDAEWIYLDPFPASDGNTYVWGDVPSMYNYLSGGAFSATCSEEKMAKIMEILEAFATDKDFWLACQFGEEGIDWEYDENGCIVSLIDSEAQHAKGIGYFSCAYPNTKATYADLILNPFYQDMNNRYGQFTTLTNTCNNGWRFTGTNEAYDTYYVDVDTLADEYYYKAIAGEFDIDATWDEYVESLNNAGLQDILDEYQAYADANY